MVWGGNLLTRVNGILPPDFLGESNWSRIENKGLTLAYKGNMIMRPYERRYGRHIFLIHGGRGYLIGSRVDKLGKSVV